MSFTDDPNVLVVMNYVHFFCLLCLLLPPFCCSNDQYSVIRDVCWNCGDAYSVHVVLPIPLFILLFTIKHNVLLLFTY